MRSCRTSWAVRQQACLASANHKAEGFNEVVDCKAAMQPMILSGSTDKYCLAAQPIVTERDVRDAHDLLDESKRPALNLYFTLKVGERLRAETQRINNEHSVRGDRGKLAIVIEGKLVSARELAGPVADTVAISGFTREEAKRLAVRLKFACAAPLKLQPC